MASDLSASDRSTIETSSSDESEASTLRTPTLAQASTALTIPTVDLFGRHVIEPVKKQRKDNRRKWKGLDAIADPTTRIKQEVGHAVGGSELCPPGDYPAVLELEDEGEPFVQHMQCLAAKEKPLAGHVEMILLTSTAVIIVALLLSENKCNTLLVIPSITVFVMLGRVLASNATNNLWVQSDAPLHCVTQKRGIDGALRAQIGLIDRVPRWATGTELKYVICAETFPSPAAAALAASNLAQAIDLFADVPVAFREVTRNTRAHFSVVYRDFPDTGEANVLASAFFPNRGPRETRTLHVYALAFRQKHIGNQVQILAHEVGHILGLRHEFAPESAEWRSLTYGRRNPGSIMSYPADWSTAKVTQQDIDELKAFYLDPNPFLGDEDTGDSWFVQRINPPESRYPYEIRPTSFWGSFFAFRQSGGREREPVMTS
ncbi:hypothetical protein QBC40DRAFT_282349 [Triangularia verruculosa]|uniref:Peptidase metallopeptidase domain-containing protein n=1 Tax=Triangularia verruculosa TaxID=2587418 RepID=A0AAN7AVN4_9PEZI|nr:hypothetical protein QBC40DRAFT_282349 [Triangularia verruculosa]